MFFKSDIKQKDGRDYRYYRLCESYREGRHIRNRTLLAVGDLKSLLPSDRIPLLAKRINQVYHMKIEKNKKAEKQDFNST